MDLYGSYIYVDYFKLPSHNQRSYISMKYHNTQDIYSQWNQILIDWIYKNAPKVETLLKLKGRFIELTNEYIQVKMI